MELMESWKSANLLQMFLAKMLARMGMGREERHIQVFGYLIVN
jgi:hypothetical protein